MKQTIGLLFICLIAGSFAAQAQQGNRGGQRRTVEERVKATLDKLTPALKLDNAQVTQTESAYTTYYKDMEKLREGMQPGTRPDMTAFRKLNTEREEKLKKIFTEEQFKKFKDEVEPSMRPQRRGNNGQQMQDNNRRGNREAPKKAA